MSPVPPCTIRNHLLTGEPIDRKALTEQFGVSMMAAKTKRRRRERRGRPPSAQARRRQTTAAGRAPERDQGTPELLDHRRRATSSKDLPHDLAGSLLGRGLIDAAQYRALREFAELVRIVRLGFGLTEASCAGQWRNILTAAHGGWGQTVPAGAEHARRVLARLRREMAPPVWQAVADAADDIWPERIVHDVAVLAGGLDHLARRLPQLARRR